MNEDVNGSGPNGDAMIHVAGLVKRFNGTTVLSGVSLEVKRGETAAIIGGSGSGKSTLLRCINALETFESGRVRVGEHTLSPGERSSSQEQARRQLRLRVGMVFQQFHLFPHMSVMENVMCGPVFAQGISRDEAAGRARRLLDRVGLGEKVNARPGTLSGGQQQRVAIARALANEPAAILFDEPTSALDPRMTGEVLAVIADLASSGQTMVIVSHSMGFVRRSAHRVHVLAGGEVVESGSAEEVFEGCRHPRTRELLTEARLA